DLARVQQQAAGPARLMGEGARLLERRDVHLLEPSRPALDGHVRVGDVDLARAHRLALAAHERDARLVALVDLVVEGRPPVLDDELVCGAGGHGGSSGYPRGNIRVACRRLAMR